MYHLHTFSCTYFYSHPREGGDIEDSNFVERQYISIHAPAKGATIITDEKYHNVTDFYSRPREGGDSNGEIKKGDMVLFLFTPPRRGRHGGYLVKFGNYTNFYSRPREGGDCSISAGEGNCLLFLFTPPRRGRQHTFIIFISICVQLLSIMHNAISLLFIFRT